MHRFDFVFFSILLSVFSGASSWAAKESTPIVFVKKAELQTLSNILSYPARVEPRIQASVLADADGVVSKITSPLGQKVKVGQKLLVIRNMDPVYEYAPMSVTSPVAGVVSQVFITEGSRVNRGDKLILITDPTQVRVSVEIAAQDLSEIHQGLKGELNLPGQEDSVAVVVKGISPFVDPATGTASCELEITKKSSVVSKTSKKVTSQIAHSISPLPGILGRVSFRVKEHQAFLVSESAVTYKGKDRYLRLVEKGKAKLVPVTLGASQFDKVEVTKGLKPGDQIIERTSAFISDGEAVQVEADTEHPASPPPQG
jgi:multidrug efflux pump subunit AcrA (membrane-fusion protein)